MIRRLTRWLLGTDREVLFLQQQIDFVSERLETYHDFRKQDAGFADRSRELSESERLLMEARMKRIDLWLQRFSQAQGVGLPVDPMSDTEWAEGSGTPRQDFYDDVPLNVEDIIKVALEDEEGESDGG